MGLAGVRLPEAAARGLLLHRGVDGARRQVLYRLPGRGPLPRSGAAGRYRFTTSGPHLQVQRLSAAHGEDLAALDEGQGPPDLPPRVPGYGRQRGNDDVFQGGAVPAQRFPIRRPSSSAVVVPRTLES